MYAKIKNIYAWREQAIIREIATHDLYCCLLPRCEALRTCRSVFPIATKWCCDQDVEVVLSSAFYKAHALGVVRYNKKGMLLQPLRWCCVDCVMHHERDVREEQKKYIHGASKQ